MNSFRKNEANRRNAQRSTGPVTEAGKQRSRRNAVRHGLTAETILYALEDAEDYAAFQMAVTIDFDPRSAVERELVLRLASVLWRLRRATAIESGLFKIQAQHLLQFRRARGACAHQQVVDHVNAADPAELRLHASAQSSRSSADQFDDLTQSYVRLANLPTCPLDRLSRYEAALWRQAYQLLLALNLFSSGIRRRGTR